MSQVNAYIPIGTSIQERAVFINELKQSFITAWNFLPSYSCVCLEEFPEYNQSANGADELFMIVFTTVGKTQKMKDELAALCHEAAVKAFGGKARATHIIFDEHTEDNVCIRGRLVSRIDPSTRPTLPIVSG